MMLASLLLGQQLVNPWATMPLIDAVPPKIRKWRRRRRGKGRLTVPRQEKVQGPEATQKGGIAVALASKIEVQPHA